MLLTTNTLDMCRDLSPEIEYSGELTILLLTVVELLRVDKL